MHNIVQNAARRQDSGDPRMSSWVPRPTVVQIEQWAYRAENSTAQERALRPTVFVPNMMPG